MESVLLYAGIEGSLEGLNALDIHSGKEEKQPVAIAPSDCLHKSPNRILRGDLYDVPTTIITCAGDEYGLWGGLDSPSEITILTVGENTTDQKIIADGREEHGRISFRKSLCPPGGIS